MSRHTLKIAAAVLGAGLVAGGTLAAYPSVAHTDEPRIPGVVTFNGLSRHHTTAHVHYAQTPPVGGPHAPLPLNCGIYPTPVPNENAVHSLEHGAVWITYRPRLPVAQVRYLRALVRGQAYLLLSPYPGLPSPVAASAWGRQLRLPSAFDPRLKRFIAVYRAGPQTPERGAPCSGGIGRPS